jgi:hypothetical protein
MMTCELCGSPVTVYTSREGTMHYVPAGNKELREAAWALYWNVTDENGRKYAPNDKVLTALRVALEKQETP